MSFFKKIKRKLCSVVKDIKIFLRFPHIWLCIFIIILAMLTLSSSYFINKYGNSYWASVLSNISAGLITGLVICLLSGVKQIYIIKLQSKKPWLENISKMIIDYMSLHHQLLMKKFDHINSDENLYDFIYDTAAHANWVNEEIKQSSYNQQLSFNAENYFKKYFNYDAISLSDIFEELHEYLYTIDLVNSSKKEILDQFDPIDRQLRKLNSAIHISVKELELQLLKIERTII